MLRNIIILFMVIILNGCVCEPLPPKVVTETIYVKVPVKHKLPDINCDFSGDGFEPTEKLLQCIVKQKRVIELNNEDNTTRP